MANAYNKVVYGNNTLIDLTGDTATAGDVALGKTFHQANGQQGVGTLVAGGDFEPQRIHFGSDGSITYYHGSISDPDYYYVVQDFPAAAITRYRKYDGNDTLLATKTTTYDALTGDIVDTIT